MGPPDTKVPFLERGAVGLLWKTVPHLRSGTMCRGACGMTRVIPRAQRHPYADARGWG